VKRKVPDEVTLVVLPIVTVVCKKKRGKRESEAQ
jgi:hypothetical protein